MRAMNGLFRKFNRRRRRCKQLQNNDDYLLTEQKYARYNQAKQHQRIRQFL